MRSIYSRRFIAGMVTGPTGNLTYTVPVGYVGIIRSMQAVQNSTGTSSANFLLLAGATVLSNVWGVRYLTTTAVASSNLDCRIVVNAGETIKAVCTTLDMWVTISGYLLIV